MRSVPTITEIAEAFSRVMMKLSADIPRLLKVKKHKKLKDSLVNTQRGLQQFPMLLILAPTAERKR